MAVLVIGWYLRGPWSDLQLAERAHELTKSEDSVMHLQTLRDLLGRLGESYEPPR